ncbi:MAG: hypothetical protein M0036_03185 [Desulfobacteraceae bacterium]|nr:hypothetical protein [Desulfobacteraceae bacterium]
MRGQKPANYASQTAAAFKTLAISQHTEQFIIAALRKAKTLSLSLVAAEKDEMVICNCCQCCCETVQVYYRGAAPVTTYAAYHEKPLLF